MKVITRALKTIVNTPGDYITLLGPAEDIIIKTQMCFLKRVSLTSNRRGKIFDWTPTDRDQCRFNWTDGFYVGKKHLSGENVNVIFEFQSWGADYRTEIITTHKTKDGRPI